VLGTVGLLSALGIVGATQFCQPVIRSVACTIKVLRS